jgi:rhomboid family GlyGly-CTERM serine protease
MNPCTSNRDWRQWFAGTLQPIALTLCLSFAAIVVWLLPGLSEAWQFDRAAVAAGEWGRVATCHLTHWSFDHLFWDVAAFGVLGAMCERRSRGAFLACVLASAALVPLAIEISPHAITTYRGLSGIDTGLFVLLTVSLLVEFRLHQQWGWFAAVGAVLIGLLLKTTFEYSTGQTLFVDNVQANFTPLPAAHVIGGAVGLVVGLLALRFRSTRFGRNASSPGRVGRVSRRLGGTSAVMAGERHALAVIAAKKSARVPFQRCVRVAGQVAVGCRRGSLRHGRQNAIHFLQAATDETRRTRPRPMGQTHHRSMPQPSVERCLLGANHQPTGGGARIARITVNRPP